MYVSFMYIFIIIFDLSKHLKTNAESHLVHVKRAEHLLYVSVGPGVQASQPEELLELVQGELTRRALGHELLVPEVHLHRLQVVHSASC